MKTMFWVKVKVVAAAVCAVVTVVAAGEPALTPSPLPGGEGPGVRVERKGPLAGLPSAPGPHIEKIKAMGDNTWLDLGSPAPDPKWGDGIGRAYSPRMAYAGDLRGAFLYGEGVHGATTKRNGKRYYNDDLFLYDINGHRWVCAYPGFEIGTYSSTVTIDKDGFETTKDGPVPIASIVHGYGNLAYDHVRKWFMFTPDPSGGHYWKDSMPERAAGKVLANLNEKQVNAWSHMSPWIFDTVEGRWTAKRTETKAPPFMQHDGGSLEYVASTGKVYFVGRVLSAYDPVKNTWEMLPFPYPLPIKGTVAASCLDTKRDRIYFPGGSSKGPDGAVKHIISVFDVKASKFLDLNPTGDAMIVHDGEGGTCMATHYDSTNDAVLFFCYGNRSGKNPGGSGVVAYSPDKNELTLATKEIPGGGCRTAFYDPELNAHFMFCAGDSAPGGKMYVYRYKRAPEKK